MTFRSLGQLMRRERSIGPTCRALGMESPLADDSAILRPQSTCQWTTVTRPMTDDEGACLFAATRVFNAIMGSCQEVVGCGDFADDPHPPDWDWEDDFNERIGAAAVALLWYLRSECGFADPGGVADQIILWGVCNGCRNPCTCLGLGGGPGEWFEIEFPGAVYRDELIITERRCRPHRALHSGAGGPPPWSFPEPVPGWRI